jgi:hypothetical protein
LFDEQDAFPEKVNESPAIAEQLDWLFKCGYAAAADTEDLKKFVVEGLRFASFVIGVLPLLGKASGAGADFAPTEVHSFGSLGFENQSIGFARS